MPQTILVVDNNPDVLTQFKSVLGDTYKLWAFRSATRALRALGEGVKPQLVFCNIRLDGVAALEFKALIQDVPDLPRAPHHRDIPVIFIIPYAEKRLFERVLPKETHNILLLPFGERELLALVERFLALPKPR